ncbi:UreD urease accessory protein-domain-containing protein [Syncephalis plumigaleata]|nr:UreD urease accessory protein-domain-containing protein [Syncephalis plumigaleata]
MLLEAGDGEVHCELGPNGKACLPVMRARYPLKLLAPRAHQAKSALIYALRSSGGLVSGDCPSMKVRVMPGAALTMLTQGSTKVFKRRQPMISLMTSPLSPSSSPSSSSSSSSSSYDTKKQDASPNDRIKDDLTDVAPVTTFQRVDAKVAERAVLLQLPEPITCFAGADFVQRQRYLLADESSSVVIADWFTSGRHDAHGESWQFHKYDSSIELYRHGRLVLADRTLLEMDEDESSSNSSSNTDDDTSSSNGSDTLSPPLSPCTNNHAHVSIQSESPTNTTTRLPRYARTLEPYRCHATIIVYGDRVKSVVEQIRAEYSKVSISSMKKASHNTVPNMQEHVWAVSDTRDKAGVILRAASTTTEYMRLWMRGLLRDIEPICGDLVYERVFTS